MLSDRGKVQQELSDRVTTSRNEMSKLHDMRERKVQQWEKKKELKEMLLVREKDGTTRRLRERGD